MKTTEHPVIEGSSVGKSYIRVLWILLTLGIKKQLFAYTFSTLMRRFGILGTNIFDDFNSIILCPVDMFICEKKKYLEKYIIYRPFMKNFKNE